MFSTTAFIDGKPSFPKKKRDEKDFINSDFLMNKQHNIVSGMKNMQLSDKKETRLQYGGSKLAEKLKPHKAVQSSSSSAHSNSNSYYDDDDDASSYKSEANSKTSKHDIDEDDLSESAVAAATTSTAFAGKGQQQRLLQGG